MLFAEGDGPGWGSVAAVVTNIGFSAVVAWYLLSKALPKMQEDFRVALKEQRDKYDAREAVRREEHKGMLQAVIDHCERESRGAADLVKVDLAQMARTMESVGEVLEEVRDCLTVLGQRRRRRGHEGPPKPP